MKHENEKTERKEERENTAKVYFESCQTTNGSICGEMKMYNIVLYNSPLYRVCERKQFENPIYKSTLRSRGAAHPGKP